MTFDTGPHGQLTPPSEYDECRYVAQMGPYLMEASRRARKYAVHHSNVNVGAIAVVRTTGGELDWLRAANQNLRPGSNPTKECAEQRLLKMIRDQERMRGKVVDKIVAMFVCGPPQPDTQSGIAAPTMHTCGECRCYLKAEPEIRDDTLMTHVHPDIDAHEMYTFAELLDLHAEPQAEPTFNYHVDPGFGDWEQGRTQYDLLQNPFLASPPLTSGVELLRRAVTGQLVASDGAV